MPSAYRIVYNRLPEGGLFLKLCTKINIVFISGARLGQMQSMAGLASVLHKYSVEPAACSLKEPIPDPTGYVVEGFVGGLPLKISKRVK